MPTRRWLAATRAEHRARQHRVASDLSPGGDDGERPGRRDAQRVHRLGDHVLAQHRPDRSEPVATTGERRPPRALQVEVPAVAGSVDDLAHQQGSAVAQTRRVAAELVTGVGLRHRLGTLGHHVADQHRDALVAAQHLRVRPERSPPAHR